MKNCNRNCVYRDPQRGQRSCSVNLILLRLWSKRRHKQTVHRGQIRLCRQLNSVHRHTLHRVDVISIEDENRPTVQTILSIRNDLLGKFLRHLPRYLYIPRSCRSLSRSPRLSRAGFVWYCSVLPVVNRVLLGERFVRISANFARDPVPCGYTLRILTKLQRWRNASRHSSDIHR